MSRHCSQVVFVFCYIYIYQNFDIPEDLSAYEGLELRLKGDGHRYKLIVRTSKDWDALGYASSFDTEKDQWQSVSVSLQRNFFSFDFAM